MILLEKKEKRKYDIVIGTRTEIEAIKNEGTEEEVPAVFSTQVDKHIASLELVFSPATNKFHKIVEFVEDCSEILGEEFDAWFEQYLTEYIDSNYNSRIVKKHIPELKRLADKYLEACEINFENYINKKKVSKNSIFFDAEEIKKLIQVSNYLKLYFIIAQDSIMKLPTKFHREIYNDLVSPISECNILYKLFKIVSSKTYRYNLTDQYMWEYIKSIYCKTTDMHIMTIFNFLVNNILVACDPKVNPVPFMINVVDEAIRWILQSVYKGVVIYSDTINTEDIYSLQGKDNLKTYAYNDTIGKLVLLAYNCLDQEGISDVRFNESLSGQRDSSLFSTYVAYPMLCKVLNIPYRHFLTVPCEHGYLLNILLYHYLPDSFKEKYPTISKLLCYYNKDKVINKTTYKIKNLEFFYSDKIGTFLGFKNLTFVYEFYSNIVGKLARNTYVDLKTDKELTNFPLAKLEADIVQFYIDYFDGRMTDTFKELEEQIDRIL